MKPDNTVPIDNDYRNMTPRLVITPMVRDPATGAVYIHESLQQAQAPWEATEHVQPMRAVEKLGDIASWVAYVQRYGGQGPSAPFLTWNSSGLRAVLDYATAAIEAEQDPLPGRCQWEARHPFECSTQWRAWKTLANGEAIGQRPAVERLEDLAEDIREPTPADLMSILRSLRASVNAKADTELMPDGTTRVAFTKDSAVKSGPGSVELPAFITIAIPVLQGHLSNGKPILYKLQVRIRVSVDDNAHLALRLTIPNSERVLEDVYADLVQRAGELLGEGFALLRASD